MASVTPTHSSGYACLYTYRLVHVRLHEGEQRVCVRRGCQRRSVFTLGGESQQPPAAAAGSLPSSSPIHPPAAAPALIFTTLPSCVFTRDADAAALSFTLCCCTGYYFPFSLNLTLHCYYSHLLLHFYAPRELATFRPELSSKNTFLHSLKPVTIH